MIQYLSRVQTMLRPQKRALTTLPRPRLQLAEVKEVANKHIYVNTRAALPVNTNAQRWSRTRTHTLTLACTLTLAQFNRTSSPTDLRAPRTQYAYCVAVAACVPLTIGKLAHTQIPSQSEVNLHDISTHTQ